MASTLHPILHFPLYFWHISPASTEIPRTRLSIPATVQSVVPAPLPCGGEFVIINNLPGTCKYETLHAVVRLIQAVRFYWTMAGRTRASISLARRYQITKPTFWPLRNPHLEARYQELGWTPNGLNLLITRFAPYSCSSMHCGVYREWIVLWVNSSKCKAQSRPNRDHVPSFGTKTTEQECTGSLKT